MDYAKEIQDLAAAVVELQDEQARAALQENHTLTRLEILENRLAVLETPIEK